MIVVPAREMGPRELLKSSSPSFGRSGDMGRPSAIFWWSSVVSAKSSKVSAKFPWSRSSGLSLGQPGGPRPRPYRYNSFV